MDYLKFNDYELLYLISWHQEEALNILLKKYTNLIEIKLKCFKVMAYHLEDYKQECLMTLMEAIDKYNDTYQKTFYRFAELFIDRRISRLLYNDTRANIANCDISLLMDQKTDVISEVSYERLVVDLERLKLTPKEKNLLREVIIGGEKANSYAKRHKMKQKEVYNGLYSLKNKVRKKIY